MTWVLLVSSELDLKSLRSGSDGLHLRVSQVTHEIRSYVPCWHCFLYLVRSEGFISSAFLTKKEKVNFWRLKFFAPSKILSDFVLGITGPMTAADSAGYSSCSHWKDGALPTYQFFSKGYKWVTPYVNSHLKRSKQRDFFLVPYGAPLHGRKWTITTTRDTRHTLELVSSPVTVLLVFFH